MNPVAARFLTPLGWLYQGAVSLKNYFYDSGLVKSHKVPVRVISVGNLTWGGTGKTPVIDYLLNYLEPKGRRPAVLSRGYRRKSSGFREVQLEKDWKEFGDEPVLLKRRHPQVPVFVHVDRVAACMKIAEKQAASVVLLDDGFQHRRVARDWDVVLVDASEPAQGHLFPPQGRAREAWASLSRAQAAILTKVNLANSEQLHFYREKLRRVPVVLELSYVCAGLRDLATRELLPVQSLKGQSVCLLSAIGRPGAFEKLCVSELGVQVQEHFQFADHHEFTLAEQEMIFTRAKSHGVTRLLLTEKDSIKWKQIPLDGMRCFVVELKLVAVSGEKFFFEKLDQILS